MNGKQKKMPKAHAQMAPADHKKAMAEMQKMHRGMAKKAK